MITADMHIKTDFAIRAHQLELVGCPLIVEEFGEVRLVALDIADMYECNALAEMPRSLNKVRPMSLKFA